MPWGTTSDIDACERGVTAGPAASVTGLEIVRQRRVAGGAVAGPIRVIETVTRTVVRLAEIRRLDLPAGVVAGGALAAVHVGALVHGHKTRIYGRLPVRVGLPLGVRRVAGLAAGRTLDAVELEPAIVEVVFCIVGLQCDGDGYRAGVPSA